MIVGDMEIRLRADIARLQRDMDQARQVVGDAASAVGRAAEQMKAALGAIGLGAGLAQIIQMSDQYTKFTAQLRLATQSQREYTQAYADVKRISTEAQASLAGTGTLYARIANGTRDLGIAQSKVADITETVNLALKVSGATAEESASAQLQLSQAFASGTLRGEEFNAVNEAAPRLMKALADGMGVPVGALKDMASNGLITSKVMADVLPQALEKLRAEGAQIQTISGAMQVLKDRFMEFTAVQAQANGVVSLLTSGIGALSNNLTLVTGVVSTLAAVNVVNWMTAWLAKTYERITAAYAQVVAENAIRAASLAAIETDIARAAAELAVATATKSAILVAREEAVVRLTQANANIVAASAAIEAATAAGAQSFALRTLRLATSELAVAEAARAAQVAELAVLGQQQARVSAQITAATAAQTAAQTALTAAGTAGTVAAGVAGRALGLLGGPIGIIVTLLGLAATAWSVWGSSSEKGNTQAAESFEEANARIIKGLDEQIAKNEKLILLQNGGLTKAKADRDLPIMDQLAKASALLNDINSRTGDFAPDKGKTENDAFFARYKVLQDISALTEKMQKRDATEDAAAAVGPAAQALIAVRERLTGVNKQYLDDLKALQTARDSNAIGEKEYIGLVAALATETYKKSEAGKDSVAGMKKEQSAYETLISSIRGKTAENQLELSTGKDATESEKTAIKITEELASGKLKLSAAHRAVLTAALLEQAASEKSLKLQAAQADVTKFIVASTTARDESAKALGVEYSMYGKSADAREIETVALKAQADTQKKLADLEAAKLPVTDQIIAQLKAEEAARTLVGQATLGQTKALQYAAGLKTENTKFAAESLADPKARADALLAIDATTWQERIKLAGDGTKAQELLQAEYNTWYANQSKKILVDVDLTRATELLKIVEAVDDAARQAASGMEDAFGAVGKAIGGLTTALTGYERAQATVAAQLKAAIVDSKGDTTKIAKANAAAAAASAQSQIKSYGDMAGAAKGFFSEGSKGYKVLETTEKAFRAYEMGMALESMVKKIFYKEGEVAATTALNTVKLTGEAATTAASTGLAATEASAWGITAVVKALASLPFPANIAAGAVTLAAVVAIGAKLVGGLSGGTGGGQSAEDMQATQGTGTVFGDSSAKTDSIRKSIELLADNSTDMLPINQGMLTALKAIESAMTGLTNLVVQNQGVTDGTNMGIQTGMLSGGTAVSNLVASIGEKVFGTSNILGTLSRTLANLYSKTTQTIVDSGLQYEGSLRALESGNGFSQYASVDTTKSSFFGLSKSTSNAVVTQGLSAELSNQFALIFKGLDDSLQAAAVAMGGSAADVTAVLNSLTLESTKVSLKGLTGDDLTDAINSVISKSMDEVAKAVFPEFEQFREVGEGYAETVLRIANDYAKLDVILASTGTTFGATGLSSIAARENLISLAGGIDELASQTSSFATDFLTKAEQLAPVQKYVTDQLAAMGLQSLDTRDKFKDYLLGLADSGALLNTTGDITVASQAQYTALLALESAFAQTHAATVDLTKSEQEIADERTDLQTRYDEATMTTAQLAEKARAAIAPYNQALYDSTTAAEAAKTAADALATANKNYRDQIDALVAKSQGSAAVRALETAGMDASTIALYDRLAALNAEAAAQTALTTAQSTLLDAYNKQESALQSVVDLQNSAADATQKMIDSLSSGDLSTLSPEQKYLQAQQQFDAAAPGDDKNAAAQALLTASRAYNGSTDAYAADYAKVQSVLALQVASQKSAATIAQQQLAALDDQVDSLIDITSGVDDLNATMIAVQQAIIDLGKAMLATAAANVAAGVGDTSNLAGQGKTAIDGALTGIYSDVLGRAPDAAGLAYWEKAIESGVSYADVVAAFKASPEYLDGSHANGLDFVPFDGYRAELHRGERVQTAAQVSSDRTSNAEMVQLLKSLVAEAKADKTQRAAAVDATVSGINKELKSLKATTKASAMRATAETTT